MSLPPIPSPLVTTILPCPGTQSLHNLEHKHGGCEQALPCPPLPQACNCLVLVGLLGQLSIVEDGGGGGVEELGAWGAARPRWVLRQAAGCGAPPTTTHRQKPPGHNPHAASTSPNLRKKITKKSLCGKLFCILTVKLSVTKGKEAWRGLIWWRALGRCLVKKNNRRAD